MYEVIQYFTDLQDFNHPYKVGDEYPRKGLVVNDKRLSELSGSHNKQKKPLIRLVLDGTSEEITDEPKPEQTVEETKYTKTDINRMSKEDLVALAAKVGIENAEEASGADLKKMLIDHYNL